MKTKETRGLRYFIVGLLCFLALGFDAIQQLIDPLIYRNMTDQSFFNQPWYVIISHWWIVIAVWTLASLLVIRWLNNRGVIDSCDFKWSNHLYYLIPLTFVLSILLVQMEQVFDPSRSPQIYREYLSFVSVHGSKGLLVSVTQNIYYLVESVLVLLLLVLMQKSGEIWFKRKWPWGSVGLALTWGLGHLSHGGFATLWICSFALLVGGFYLVTRRNIWVSYLFIVLVFML